ncbi:alpha/beta hydrolase family protein [Natronosporangium hydrolyticum]|uniref:alpha/beta hydrolase family protein n=1 Tax=Natronosporangium hydrolyticum TaxID=2811111 RepID=UPI001EFA0AFC|nr:alpha/beta hydrolase [Natronosporangium hydrolyticum]
MPRFSASELADRPPDLTPQRHRRRWLARAAATIATAVALTVGSTAVAPSALADEQFWRGPNPTESALEAPSGPYTTSSTRVSSLVSGFGGGRIYYPVTTSDGTFGAIAISPGYTASWSTIDWLGPFLASHGFVVIGINTNSRFDQPGSRSTQLLNALDYLVDQSSERHRVDPDRLAVSGHSMGGGGAVQATRTRTSLLASVPLTPWHLSSLWGGVQTPTMVIGGQRDAVAPVRSHSIPIYEAIPGSSQKAYAEMRGEGHYFPLSRDATVGKLIVSWLKRFVDFDTRYEQFLCPPPATGLFSDFSDYRDTCPHTT